MCLRRVVFGIVALAACKGGAAKDAPPASGSQAPAGSAAPATAASSADADPDFTHVDRDQLAALCVAARLPPTSVPSDHGALLLGDGSRVPWLTVWQDEALATAAEVPPITAAAWTARARTHAAHVARTLDDRAAPRTRTGREWKNLPCTGDEVLDVVVTAVFFEKQGFRAIALRGARLLEEALPTTTPRDEVFRKAFALGEQILGQPARIASHKLMNEALPTVTTEPWVKAAAK